MGMNLPQSNSVDRRVSLDQALSLKRTEVLQDSEHECSNKNVDENLI